jgi:hypothetical protein
MLEMLARDKHSRIPTLIYNGRKKFDNIRPWCCYDECSVIQLNDIQRNSIIDAYHNELSIMRLNANKLSINTHGI